MSTPETVVPATTTLIWPAIKDLGLAPENPRSDEPADEGVPQLAETLHPDAAGVIVPLAVRPGREGEQPFMVLDGRRRRFGLLHLLEAGRIDETHPVKCELFESQAAQAAAALLPNIEHAPTHLADIVVAIRNLRKAKMATKAIAGALGYSELEIKRLERLAQVNPKVLQAFRAGKLTLRQVRNFTRIADKRLQGELAQQALDGYFQDWRLQNTVNGARLTVDDPRMTLVGMTRYRAAGGRVETDLFGELPDRLLDEPALAQAWMARIEPVVEGLKAEGLSVFVSDGRSYAAPDGFRHLPAVYARELGVEARAALEAAQAAAEDAAQAIVAEALSGDAPEAVLLPALLAERALAAAPLTRMTVGAVILSPDTDEGVAAQFFGVEIPAAEAPASEDEADDEDDEAEDGAEAIATFTMSQIARAIPTPEIAVDVEGTNHLLHETRTDVATRGLIRDLADDPSTALTVLIAKLFKDLVLRASYQGESALTVSAKPYAQVNRPRIPALDGEVWARLEARAAAFAASGERPIGWVASLAHGDKMSLLAELVAVSLDLFEARTTNVRRKARAEAAEIATLCGADIAIHWSPDAAYCGVHSKGLLLRMLAEMAVDDPRAKLFKKDELAGFTADAAAERSWAPKVLSWQAGLIEDAAPEDEEEATAAAAPTADVEEAATDAVTADAAPADAQADDRLAA